MDFPLLKLLFFSFLLLKLLMCVFSFSVSTVMSKVLNFNILLTLSPFVKYYQCAAIFQANIILHPFVGDEVMKFVSRAFDDKKYACLCML